MPAPPVDIETLAVQVVAGDRAALARAITLVESSRGDDRDHAQQFLVRLLPHTGGAVRVGISGVPGAGKSTLIDALGVHLIDQGRRVAVLAVDPSSTLSGGSILGDKTRMARLGRDPRAFVRPSPTGGSLGGIARRSRESMLVCEAAGFDVVLVETVGVGQSETAVSEIVDAFVVLLVAGAGDELQGIKRGILELVDVLVLNKADGEGLARAEEACGRYASALQLMRRRDPAWRPRVMTASAQTGAGVDSVWAVLEERRVLLEADGTWERRRQRQALAGMWRLLAERLEADVRRHPAVQARLADVESDVIAGRLTAALGAQALLDAAGWKSDD